MALDLWFREDVKRIIASTYDTMQSSTAISSSQNSGETDVYRQGFTDALRVIAIAFGLGSPSSADRSEAMTVGHLSPGSAEELRWGTDGR